MRRTRVTALLAVACVAAVVAGCGGDDDNKSSSGSAPTKAPTSAKKGGTLTMIASGDVDNKLDPGYSYYQYDFILDEALHRTL